MPHDTRPGVLPTLLIASPQMKDAFFERTIVLVWHHDEDGAVGVVLNRILEHKLSEVLDLPDVDLDGYEDAQVGWGGPVEGGTGTVVSTAAVDDEEGWTLPGGLGVTRSQDALVRLARARAPMILCLGYAGWGPGQLDQEIASGGWLWTDCDAALIFGVPEAERYDRALAALGLTRNTVWMPPIDE